MFEEFEPKPPAPAKEPPAAKLPEGRAFVGYKDRSGMADGVLAVRIEGQAQATTFETRIRAEGFCLYGKDAKGNIEHAHFSPAKITDVTVFRVCFG